MHITANKWSKDHLTINSVMTRGPSRSLLKILILNELIVVKFYSSVSTLKTRYGNNETKHTKRTIQSDSDKVLWHILRSSFLLVYSCMSFSTKVVLKETEKGWNKQLSETNSNNMLCVWNYSNKCIGKEMFLRLPDLLWLRRYVTNHLSLQRERDHALRDHRQLRNFLKMKNTATVTKRYRATTFYDTNKTGQNQGQKINQNTLTFFH